MAPDEAGAALPALAGLLDEFRHGRITDLRAERDGIDRHTGALSSQWDHKFPGFPAEYFPFTSFRGEHYRGRRDAYLKSIIVQMLRRHEDGEATIVNPACVFGRHARDLASRLGRFEVICTDIDPNWFRLYRCARLRRLPGNLTFVKDNIFDPRLEVRPTAVVFFGACGAVSDAAIDYAIRARSFFPAVLMFAPEPKRAVTMAGSTSSSSRFSPKVARRMLTDQRAKPPIELLNRLQMGSLVRFCGIMTSQEMECPEGARRWV